MTQICNGNVLLSYQAKGEGILFKSRTVNVKFRECFYSQECSSEGAWISVDLVYSFCNNSLTSLFILLRYENCLHRATPELPTLRGFSTFDSLSYERHLLRTYPVGWKVFLEYLHMAVTVYTRNINMHKRGLRYSAHGNAKWKNSLSYV